MPHVDEFEMGLPNGVGEQMLAHAIEKFDVKLKHTEYGPKLVGQYEELERVQEFFTAALSKRVRELEER